MKTRLPPIAFNPRPSRQLAIVLRSLQCLTLGVLIAAPVNLGVKILLLAMLVLQVVLSHRRLFGNSPRRVAWVRIDAEQGARLIFTDGRKLETRLRNDSLITPWLILLRFEGERLLHRPSLLLGRDSLAAAELRRLRILLRFGSR